MVLNKTCIPCSLSDVKYLLKSRKWFLASFILPWRSCSYQNVVHLSLELQVTESMLWINRRKTFMKCSNKRPLGHIWASLFQWSQPITINILHAFLQYPQLVWYSGHGRSIRLSTLAGSQFTPTRWTTNQGH